MRLIIVNITSWVLTVAIALTAGFFVYVYMFPHPNYYVSNEPIEVVSKTVHEGEPVVYRSNVCIKRDVIVDYNVVLIKDEGTDQEKVISFPSRSLSLKADPQKPCRYMLSQTVTIPKGTESGTWHIQFNVNVYESFYPVRRASYRTQDFQVIGVEPTENQININVNEGQSLPELKSTQAAKPTKPVLIPTPKLQEEATVEPIQTQSPKDTQEAQAPEIINLGAASQ